MTNWHSPNECLQYIHGVLALASEVLGGHELSFNGPLALTLHFAPEEVHVSLHGDTQDQQSVVNIKVATIYSPFGCVRPPQLWPSAQDPAGTLLVAPTQVHGEPSNLLR